METPYNGERRRHRRYIVPGQVEFHAMGCGGIGSLVNISQKGMLFRGSDIPGGATELHVSVQVDGFWLTVEALGQIVGARDGGAAIRFCHEPNGLDALLQWLDRENYPWSGVIGSDDAESPPSPSKSLPVQGSGSIGLESEALRQQLFRSG